MPLRSKPHFRVMYRLEAAIIKKKKKETKLSFKDMFIVFILSLQREKEREREVPFVDPRLKWPQ